MFDTFRQNVKRLAKERNLTYAQIAEKSGVEESTIKCFMCGANDSRRIAEKIADVLNISLIYSNGEYKIINEREIVR
ncbi:MAG: helix-turn-helix domain protein [Bacteriophage sp.]|nr:MAG: helix-turn-helix domain protein [Bacteriophage sp.]